MKKEIAELYLENISNTQFVSEPLVTEYLRSVHVFLKKYFTLYNLEDFNRRDWLYKEEYDLYGLLRAWQEYIVCIVYETYNSFLLGNFITALAMTRTLIESYVYYSILQKEGNTELMVEWIFSSYISDARFLPHDYKQKVKEVHEKFYKEEGFNSDGIWERYIKSKKYGDEWLNNLPLESTFFSDCCKYIGEKNIYKDYSRTSKYVHAQSPTTKFRPFIFYEMIYEDMALIMKYIFKALRVFNRNKDAEFEMKKLEENLFKLKDDLFGKFPPLDKTKILRVK